MTIELWPALDSIAAPIRGDEIFSGLQQRYVRTKLSNQLVAILVFTLEFPRFQSPNQRDPCNNLNPLISEFIFPTVLIVQNFYFTWVLDSRRYRTGMFELSDRSWFFIFVRFFVINKFEPLVGWRYKTVVVVANQVSDRFDIPDRTCSATHEVSKVRRYHPHP
jgi:hypothetical protein